jgi:hypothetical protein
VTASLSLIDIYWKNPFKKVGVVARRAVGTTGVYRQLCTDDDRVGR